MNIFTVRDNLKNTIAGKEKYLQDLVEKAEIAVFPEVVAYNAMVEMLAINIDELKRILADVEVCCEQHSLMSWEINPERMGQ